jgi:hypothetical protein
MIGIKIHWMLQALGRGKQEHKTPLDGDIWIEDPLHSSYPPSIAFKAAHSK